MERKAALVNETVEKQARELLAAAPASVELPAGTGKTHSLAAAVKEAAKLGKRSLILTHTNAGVDAIRKRLSRFKVSIKMYSVYTISSWAFTLVRSYQNIAGVNISAAPDWSKSDEYLSGAINVAKSYPIREVINLSYDYLFVDEYQDCVQLQHEFILALCKSIPKTIVLGDPLQSIFGFGKNVLVDWGDEVISVFPRHPVEKVAHRWANTNPALGDFLLNIRKELKWKKTINFNDREEFGIIYIEGDPTETLAEACFPLARNNETVAVLTKWPKGEDRIAQMLRGHFNVVEPMSSQRIEDSLKELPVEGDIRLAAWFAKEAKKFYVGLGRIDADLINKLGKGESVAKVRRKGLQKFVDAVAQLQRSPSYKVLLDFQNVLSEIENVRCTHKEVWRDIFRTIQYGVEEESSDWIANLGVIRSRYRHIQRKMPRLIVSRTLIVKGLEFDHVVIADLKEFSDPCELYVALSRAKKSVTVLGEIPSVSLK